MPNASFQLPRASCVVRIAGLVSKVDSTFDWNASKAPSGSGSNNPSTHHCLQPAYLITKRPIGCDHNNPWFDDPLPPKCRWSRKVCAQVLRELFKVTVMMSRLNSFGFGFAVLVASHLTGGMCSAVAQESATVPTLTDVSKRLESAAKARQQDSGLESRVRESTWRILLGELASDKTLNLSSGAYDSLTRGLSELDQLLTELEKTPDLERKLSTQTQLAMRFDAAVARRSEAVAKKDLSRTEELARLSQVRELNRAYRTLIRHLISGQTESLLGQVGETARNGEEAGKQLTLAEQIVGKRRDFYLFEDEPAIEGNNSELKLIQELAGPYSDDVRRHQRALLGVTLCRLAMQADPPSKEVLEAGLAQAEAALVDATAPNAVALYAHGLASLELGRLLTQNEPFQQQSHLAASDLFRKSQESLLNARKALPEQAKLAELRSELDRLIAEGTGPEVFLSRSLELEQRSDLKGGLGTFKGSDTSSLA